MLTSRAYGGLAKLLEALRAHDARIVETLAEQQAPSRYKPVSETGSSKSGNGTGSVSARQGAAEVLHAPDPAALAAFINLRVLNSEHEHWRRGVEAAVIYAREHGDLKVPFTFRVPAAEDTEKAGWPASRAGFPLGQWTADARRFYNRGDMDPERVAQLEKLGMVWSHFDVAWQEGLSAARGWAAEHGHLLAPVDAAYQGAQVGIWLKNARAAARKGGAPMTLVKVVGSVSGGSGRVAVVSDDVAVRGSVGEGMRPCDFCGHPVVIDSIDERDCPVCGEGAEVQPEVAGCGS
ncbi:helicase associated domain-containing protein [Streptomyces subrutilus]|uniref:helicase associated domain-containing protein n=1 Tax=Streptomyces subrutilus TaxID=36818 RepID=UPI0033EB58C1